MSVFVEERIKLLALFPEELWELLFDEIENPQDQLNLVGASQAFRELLKSKRTIYLFPQVLRVFDTRKYLTSEHSKTILDCRLVCSKWKAIVNAFLEKRRYHTVPHTQYQPGGLYSDESKADVGYPTYFRLCKFSIDKLGNEILPEISTPFYRNHNAFPSRHVQIFEKQSNRGQVHQNAEIIRYRAIAEEFLEKVGHHFWHASIETELNGVNLYELVRKYVRHMKSLNSLYIYSTRRVGDYDSETAAYISKNDVGFPTLPDLEMVGFINVPESAVNEILARNGQVVIIQNNGYTDYKLQTG